MAEYKFKINYAGVVQDCINGKVLKQDEIVTTDDKSRFNVAISMGYADFVSAKHNFKPYKKKVLVYCTWLADFGGIETATIELARRYGEKYNITIMAKEASNKMLLELSKYANVVLDDGKEIDADVIICATYDCAEVVKDRIKKTAKLYQQSHCVWDKMPDLKFKSLLSAGNRINAFLSVSNDSRRGLMERYGKDSVVVPNVVVAPDKTVIFGFFSRSSGEKGFSTIYKAVKKFRASGKRFRFIVSTTPTQSSQDELIKLKKEPEVIYIDGSQNNRGLIHMLDYIWQISDTESMGISVQEALLSGVMAICSKIPVFEDIIEHGKNGFLVSKDLSDLPIDEIFSKANEANRPPLLNVDYSALDDTWEKVFNGTIGGGK